MAADAASSIPGGVFFPLADYLSVPPSGQASDAETGKQLMLSDVPNSEKARPQVDRTFHVVAFSSFLATQLILYRTIDSRPPPLWTSWMGRNGFDPFSKLCSSFFPPFRPADRGQGWERRKEEKESGKRKRRGRRTSFLSLTDIVPPTRTLYWVPFPFLPFFRKT